MKITLLGATGPTGLHLLDQALEAGHSVTAYVRNPDKLGGRAHDRLEVVVGALSDVSALADAMRGRDAVVSALGAPAGRGPISLYSSSIAHILEAMERAAVDRLVVMSSSGLEDDPEFPWFYKYLIKPLFLRALYADMARMEATLAASKVRWTVVRPSMLVNRPLSGCYRIRGSRNPEGGWKIGRADAAHYMLRALVDPTSVGARVALAY